MSFFPFVAKTCHQKRIMSKAFFCHLNSAAFLFANEVWLIETWS